MLTSKQIENLDGDWKYILGICKIAKESQGLVEKSLNSMPVSKTILRQNLKLIREYHKQSKLHFAKKSKILRKLSPRAAEYIKKELKVFDDDLKAITYYVNRWPSGGIGALAQLSQLFSEFAVSYTDFEQELMMYRDLVQNTVKYAKFLS